MIGNKKIDTYRKDEDAAFWSKKSHEDLARLVAILHKQRRINAEKIIKDRVYIVRRAVASMFVRGEGIEVGAGSRPFPVPDGVICLYGDIRDGDALSTYFDKKAIRNDEFIDAQTYSGIKDDSFDFVISAHVIEHLENPIGSIRNAIRILKNKGIHIIAVPDREFTFDARRDGTSIEHVLQDDLDGGASTRLSDYKDFISKVGVEYFGNKLPINGYDAEAKRLSDKNHDIHFHAWNLKEFQDMIQEVSDKIGLEVICCTSVVNENIFVLRKIR